MIHTLIIREQNNFENLMFEPLREFGQYIVLHYFETIIDEKEEGGDTHEIAEKLPYLFDLMVLHRLNNICGNKGNRIGLYNRNG
jgi:hypothetical protein